jgi:glucose 1-dehydrogenase
MTRAQRTVVVTGATRGIGKAIAVAFATTGAHVAVHGRDAYAADDVARIVRERGGEASVVLGDLRHPDACEEVIEAAASLTGRVDVLVNNAGANHFTGVLGTTLDEWQACIDLDLRAPWLCARAAAKTMPVGGSIVNVTSNHARATLPGSFPYNVAKAGADALTQALAIDLAPHGIRVNAIAPGYVDTEINDAYFATFPDPARARAHAEQLHLTGRLARSEEIAAAAVFLADATLSGSTTGTVLTIDGGRAALMQDPTGDET